MAEIQVSELDLLERAHQAMLAKCHQATTMISFHGKPPDPNTNLKDYNELTVFGLY